MKQYKVIHVSDNYFSDGIKKYRFEYMEESKKHEYVLNMYAKEGWEFVQIIDVYAGYNLYLKRDI